MATKSKDKTKIATRKPWGRLDEDVKEKIVCEFTPEERAHDQRHGIVHLPIRAAPCRMHSFFFNFNNNRIPKLKAPVQSG